MSLTDWEYETSPGKARDFAKQQDAAFRAAVYRAHPHLFPKKKPSLEPVIALKSVDIPTETAPPRTVFGTEDLIKQLREVRQAHRRPVFKETLRIVSEAYGVTVEQVLGESRNVDVVHARHAIFYVLTRGGYAAAAVGRLMDRDHTSVLHGCKMHMERMEAVGAH